MAVVSGTHRSEFTYDGLDRRIRIVEKESGSTVRDAALIWAGTEIIEERLSTSVANRFWGAMEQHDGATRYATRDHLGSIREVRDVSGAIVTRNDYDPYGRISRIGGTEDSRFGYTGHYQHSASGLLLARYRAYDPVLGRWIGEDPAGMIEGLNLFAYVRNNSVGRVDPDGLKSWEQARADGMTWAQWFNDPATTEQDRAKGEAIDPNPALDPIALAAGLVAARKTALDACKAVIGKNSPLFRRGDGLLNSNDYFRIGWGWKGTADTGREVFRFSVGNKGSMIHWHCP